MLSTKTLLNPFSAIFPRIHHPPPLDKRESQRLLKALTTSFRKNLDKEHGYLSRDESRATSYNPKVSSATTSPTTSHDSHRPTDGHVRAILSNPLFSYEPSKTISSRPFAEHDPMDVFDQAVAKGLMNFKRATGVLIAKRQAIAQSSSISVPQAMATSGTAHRVVSWLRSSGLERSLSFTKHQPLLNNLIPFMVEEGLDELVWIWLERWMAGGHGLAMADQATNVASHSTHSSPLLTALVRAKVSPGSSLDAGYATLIRADDMFSTHKAFPRAVLAPWRTLSVMSTIFAWQRSPPSEALFESFAAMSEQLRQVYSTKIDRAHLDLYHPTHPDATAALNCLKSDSLDRLQDQLRKVDQPTTGKHDPIGKRDPKSVAKSVVLMATDAAQHLTRIGDEAQAEWVGNLLLEKLGDFLRTELVSASPDLHLLQPAPAVA